MIVAIMMFVGSDGKQFHEAIFFDLFYELLKYLYEKDIIENYYLPALQLPEIGQFISMQTEIQEFIALFPEDCFIEELFVLVLEQKKIVDIGKDVTLYGIIRRNEILPKFKDIVLCLTMHWEFIESILPIILSESKDINLNFVLLYHVRLIYPLVCKEEFKTMVTKIINPKEKLKKKLKAYCRNTKFSPILCSHVPNFEDFHAENFPQFLTKGKNQIIPIVFEDIKREIKSSISSVKNKNLKIILFSGSL
jgi:hypothetical protein